MTVPRWTTCLVLAALLVGSCLSVARADDRPTESRGTVTPAADFDGDGFADLAVGVPRETIAATRQGAVNVIYGAAAGLSSAGAQVWHQDSPGISETAETDDEFGGSLAWGDLDGDGFDDLAIGAPREDLSVNGVLVSNVGVVHVLFGSAAGLTSAGSQIWSQQSRGVADTATVNEYFGSTLAAGALNSDVRDDLVIGVPNQKVGMATIAGAVHVLFGSVSGPTGIGSQFWNQDVAGVADVAEPEQGEVGERFGWALAIGNFGNSADLDLAIGVPGESTGRPSVMGAGAVNVLYGSASGPSTAGNQVWSQGTSGVLGSPSGGEAPVVGDSFGSALAAGDFGGGPEADLAVAAPFDDESGAGNAGAVNVLPGSASGLSATGDQFWSQATSGIAGTPGSNDAFGEALATADLGHDAHADLAIGVPADSVSTGGGAVSGGAVNVVYGTATGLTSAGSQLWDQGPLPGVPESLDRFGLSLSAANFGNSATADLAVGVPDEDTGGLLSTGVAHVVYGTAGGLSTAGSQLWDQNSPGIPGAAEEDDRFGFAAS